MKQRRLSLYTRHSYRRQNPLSGLMVMIILGIMLGGLFPLVDRMRAPRPLAAPPAAATASPTAARPTARPTLTPLAMPTVAKKPDPMTIVIPTAGINTNIVQVYLDGVSWDVSRLGYNAGHLQGTAEFGSKGNFVLAGHVEMADGRPGVFASLDEIGVGDPLVLGKGPATRRYTVRAVKTVEPDDLSILYPTTADQLTLITCGDYDFWQNVYQERFVVIADRAT